MEHNTVKLLLLAVQSVTSGGDTLCSLYGRASMVAAYEGHSKRYMLLIEEIAQTLASAAYAEGIISEAEVDDYSDEIARELVKFVGPKEKMM